MASLSEEQKFAFVGAKIVLHPAVSCKILVYDDDRVSVDENKEKYGFPERDEDDFTGDVHLTSDVHLASDAHAHVHFKERDFDQLQNKCADAEDGSCLTIKADESIATTGSGISNEARKFPTTPVPSTIPARVALSEQGDIVTVSKLSSAQDFEPSSRVTLRIVHDPTINPVAEHPQKVDEQEIEGDSPQTEDSYGHVETLLPFDILSTYLIKNLFFNCIEEDANKSSGKTVTTGRIFSKLMEFLRKCHPIPYYFIPNQYFSGLDEDSLLEDDGRDIVLVATVINSILNEEDVEEHN